MSWKAGLSRYLPSLRFSACPISPSSRGVLTWYAQNREEIKLLNPEFQFLLRTGENVMPAVTTVLDWQIEDLLKFMIQTGRFRNPDGTIAQDRIEAAQDYLKIDWDQMEQLRFSSPGFDPERPGIDTISPGWKEDTKIQNDLETYFAKKNNMQEQMSVFQGGPNDEFTRAENALLMCQRVDLWCAGPKEVDRAVVHLYKLARALNEREVEMPDFITDFTPGCDDMADM